MLCKLSTEMIVMMKKFFGRILFEVKQKKKLIILIQDFVEVVYVCF